MDTFIAVHVAISLLGILSGFVVVAGLLMAKQGEAWTAIFLVSNVATSVTGFFFPFRVFTPAHALGILSLVALILAMVALYGCRLRGGWRRTYVISAVVTLYFNFFVLIVQSFLKIPALHALAPKQTEAPFVIIQVLVFAGFLLLGITSAMSFRERAEVEA